MPGATPILLLCCMLFIVCGCVSVRDAKVVRRHPADAAALASHAAAWSLDNLSPAANTVLEQGDSIPVSIDMKAHGDGYYLLKLSATRNKFRPFVVDMNVENVGGSVDFSGQMTWFMRARRKSENVTISLYQIRTAGLNRADTSMLQQINRRYDVICNKKQGAFILFFKRLFLICKCKPRPHN